MKRVVTVSLNGLSFNLDEDAYEDLRTYLRRAESQLATDPGRAEVLADLERSIAEKCQAYLSPQKNVVTAEELRAVLVQIGTVEPRVDDGETFASSDAAGVSQPKELRQIRDGAMVSGVCNGLAAHFGIDVTLIRVIFVVLAVATSGAFILVYLALMFILPFDTYIEKLNDQSLPAFMFKFVTHTKRKFAGSV